jgi:tetratricopeptide (TPR) repeat protein
MTGRRKAVPGGRGARRRRAPQRIEAGRDAYFAARDQVVINMPASGPGSVAVPELLPRDVPGFTGREAELALLTRLPDGGTVVVTAIGGTAGVGKTALAVHAAHRLRDRFPGGQLYADLRGYTAGQVPAEPGDVLGLFLRRLGVDGADLPASADERSAMLRDVLASRRVLIVLDNVASEAQVRPLLPGTGTSLVLITSRGSLAGLEVDQRIALGILPGSKAVALLANVIGPQRAAAEPEALRQVGDRCGNLPLALRIAGQILAAHPVWTVDRLAGMLADERERLNQLTAGDRQVRSAFAASYRLLPDDQARMFRLLGLHPGPDFDAAVAASLAGIQPREAEPLLGRLILAHLITENAPGRFGMHDLLRLFARHTTNRTDGRVAAAAAISRLISHFTKLGKLLASSLDLRPRPEAADAVGSFPSPRQALAMFEMERPNLLSVLRLASDQGAFHEVTQLNDSVAPVLLMQRQLDDLLLASKTALLAAQHMHDAAAEITALRWVGTACSGQRKFEEAIACFQDALAICRQSGDQDGEGRMLNNLGSAHQDMGRFEEAIAWYRKSLAISHQAGDRLGEGRTLSNLGLACSELQRFDEAIACHKDALLIRRQAGDRLGEGRTLSNLGRAYAGLRRFNEAIICHQEALAIFQQTGDLHSQAVITDNIGLSYAGLQQFYEAITCHQEALTIFHQTGDQHREQEVRQNLTHAYARLGAHSSEQAGQSGRPGALGREAGQGDAGVDA